MSFLNLEDKPPEQVTTDAAELAAVTKQANVILAFSAISILFCCLGGIISTYFAYQGSQDANAGNILGAQHSLKIAKGWMIATYIIGILGIIGTLSEGR